MKKYDDLKRIIFDSKVKKMILKIKIGNFRYRTRQ